MKTPEDIISIKESIDALEKTMEEFKEGPVEEKMKEDILTKMNFLFNIQKKLYEIVAKGKEMRQIRYEKKNKLKQENSFISPPKKSKSKKTK